MKLREIFIDLTALLDVIFILFFSVLLLNTEQITGYQSQIHEAEEQRIIAEQELYEVEMELYDISTRLDALGEWDTERLELIDEVKAQSARLNAIGEAIFFISMNVQSEGERRVISISASPNIDERIEIIWAIDGRNVIQNDGFVRSELNRILLNIIEPRPLEQPILILFNEADIRFQEFNLMIATIRQMISQFYDIDSGFIIRYSVY